MRSRSRFLIGLTTLAVSSLGSLPSGAEQREGDSDPVRQVAEPYFEVAQDLTAFGKPGAVHHWEGSFRIREGTAGQAHLPSTAFGSYPVTTRTRPTVGQCGWLYPCHAYDLTLANRPSKHTVLRVAIDNVQAHPENFDAVELAVELPDGRRCRAPYTVDRTHGTETQLALPWSWEVVIGPGANATCRAHLELGTYRLVAIGANIVSDEPPHGPDDGDERVAGYRMRAALQHQPPVAHRRPMLPDLVPYSAPWHLALGCIAGDTDQVPGDPNCLRFSFAYGNVGEGMLDLRYDPLADDFRNPPLVQHVYRHDTTPWTYDDNEFDVHRPEATAEFHESHRHWHVPIYRVRLYTLADGTTTYTGREAGKRGLCSSAWMMAAWNEFIHERPDVAASTGCNTTAVLLDTGSNGEAARIPLPAGWADFYIQGTSDNFIDVAGLPSGTYLLQFVLNPDGHVVERRTDNNASYLVLRYEGPDALDDHVQRGHPSLPASPSVCVLERGLGLGPDDGNKRLEPVYAQACPSDPAQERGQSAYARLLGHQL